MIYEPLRNVIFYGPELHEHLDELLKKIKENDLSLYEEIFSEMITSGAPHHVYCFDKNGDMQTIIVRNEPEKGDSVSEKNNTNSSIPSKHAVVQHSASSDTWYARFTRMCKRIFCGTRT